MNMRYAMRSEDTEQINVVSWANWNVNRYPELKWLHHVPNGGSRNKQEAVKLKQMGVKAGVSDLCLPYPKGLYCGLYIEMKFGDNRQQETQKEFLADMAAAGHFVATCYSAEEAVKVIEEYCKLMNHKMGDCEIVIPLENREELRNITMSIPNNSILKNGEIKESKPRKKMRRCSRMTVKDIMTLLESPDRVRVIKDGEEIYNQYFANMEVDKDIVAQIGDAEVKRFRAIPEITHRKYKERGLIAPMKPEETPDYSFRDLQLCIYHTITI